MKFACDSCATKYSIADERVRGRVLKIRCKKCDFVITVREDVVAAAAAVVVPRDAQPGPFDSGGLVGGAPDEQQTMVGDLASHGGEALTLKGGTGGDDDWYVSFDGEQEGPFSLERALERVRAEQEGEKEAHAWRPGFLVWLPVEEVPELAPALKSAAVMTPIRAGAAAPMIPARVPRDPSGPRAALSVSLGAPRAANAPVRAEASKGAPPIPAAARAEAVPAARVGSGSGASSALFASSSSAAPEPASSSGMPELNISNEASGLVNLQQLAASAMGKPTTGPAFINGHTGRVPRVGTHTGRQPIFTPQELEALEQPENPAVAAPVVVVAGRAPAGGSHPLFKWVALGAVLLCLGLGGSIIYLLTHRPPSETIVVTEPSRHTDDSPITMTDPVTGKTVTVDAQTAAKRASAAKKTPVITKVASGKTDDAMSGSQRALADLYKDGDEHTPHAVPSAGGGHATGGGQVSNAAIIAAVGANKRTLTLCYERALKHDSSLKSGRVPIQVSVGMSGRVTSVVIPEQQYADSELGQCFVQSVKHWSFPASDAAYSTEFPFILQGQ